jgi:double-stranded uracil-DNA glycosylase
VSGTPTRRVGRAELEAARSETVPDVIGRDLAVLFCGINPGLLSGRTGHHFAHPANRFWKALERSGFTDELLSPSEERRLLEYRLGVTNLVARTTAAASELSREELRVGAQRLEALVARYRPEVVCFLGLGAYRSAFARPRAQLGAQVERIGRARCWLVANPSGLQARYQLDDLAAQLSELRATTRSR